MKTTENKMMTPFSNGTEAMCWRDENCDRCTKAFHVKDGNWPTEKTLKQYVSIGKYCKLQYDLDMAFITSEIPITTADQIGRNELGGLKSPCMFFSDNDDDGFKYPPRKPIDPTPNQLCLPIMLNEILLQESNEKPILNSITK